MDIIKSPTYGENLVNKLLEEIQKSFQADFFFQSEYRIHHANVKPDFVAVLAEHGIAVIEVKDWVGIQGGDQRSIKIKTRDGSTQILPNPVRTVEEYCYALKADLEKRGDELFRNQNGRRVLKFPWQPVVILSNIPNHVIRELENQNIFPQNIVLGQETLRDAEALYKKLKYLPWRFKLDRPLGRQTLDVLRGILNPYLKADLAGVDQGTATDKQEFLIIEPLPSAELQQLSLIGDDPLSEEAKQVVKNLTIRLVRGVAGSGKTLVLLKRAQYLQEHYPHSRIMVMTFNRDLTSYLQSRAPYLEITNFHRVCREIIGRKKWHDPLQARGWLENYAMDDIQQLGLPYKDKFQRVRYVAQEIGWRKDLGLFTSQDYKKVDRRGRGLALGEDKRRLLDEIFQKYRKYQFEQQKKRVDWMDWDDVPYVALDVFIHEGHHYQNSYDTILVDEGQDFAPTWLKVIKQMLKPSGSLFICDDPTQSLFRYFSWKQKGIDVVGRTRVLKVPFRCSRQINEAAYSLIATDPILSKNEEITQPDLKSSELLDGQQPTLYSCPSPVSEQRMVESEIQSLIRDGLLPRQIAVLCHSKRFVKHYAHMREFGIYVETFEKMKGLEFTAVFIPEITTAFERVTDDENISQVRRRIFTAMTRARQILILSHQAESPLPMALGSILPHVWRETL